MIDYPADEWIPLISDGSPDADERRRLLIDILSHPHEMPAVEELHYTLIETGSMTEDALNTHLKTLCQEGLLVRLDNSKNEFTFYSLTDEGKQFAADFGFLGLDTMKEVYERLETTPLIESARNAKRPSHPPSERTYVGRENVETYKKWNIGQEKSKRVLLATTEVNGQVYHLTLWNTETGRPLDSTSLYIDGAEEMSDCFYNSHYEGRAEVKEDGSYSIHIEANQHNVEAIFQREEEEVFSAMIYVDSGLQ